MRAATILLHAVMVVALLSACTQAAPVYDGPLDADPYGAGALATLPATHPQVQQRCPVVPAVHYDADALPASEVDEIFVCTAEPWTNDPQGVPRSMQHVDGIPSDQFPQLLQAFADSDAHSPEACPTQTPEPLILWVHHGEEITAIRAPVDNCLRPFPEAAAAFERAQRVRLVTASETEGFEN